MTTSITCRECGEIVAAGEFCPRCGRLHGTSYTKKELMELQVGCDHSDKNSNYCSKCGKRLREP